VSGEQILQGDDIVKKATVILPLLTATTPAMADSVKIQPIIDARLRYENAEQRGVADEANGVTLRMRAGAEAKFRRRHIRAGRRL
jgi:hypothetical protein